MNMEEGIPGMPDIHLRNHILGNRHHQLLHCSPILDGGLARCAYAIWNRMM